MKIQHSDIQLSASDLVGHLNCRHLTALDLKLANGLLVKPVYPNPLLESLQERGNRHEAAFVAHLQNQGLGTTAIPCVDITPDSVAATRKAMKKGTPIIIQAALKHGRWSGRADILRRVERPSPLLGNWSYEIIDTKLARETRGGSILQLCLYADLVEHMQGLAPEYFYVVVPWSNFELQSFRYLDYAAYFRQSKRAIEAAIATDEDPDTYPDPKEHCEVCWWRPQCMCQRRDDDHLCLVADITKNQINELQANGVRTVEALASMPTPLSWKPQRGSPQSYEKVRDQARIQIETRQTGKLLHEMLPMIPETGLCRLPSPSYGDVFFDIEGDPFVGEHGLEYLFGYCYQDGDGQLVYTGDWALDRAQEKAAFERFVDFITARRKLYPDLHIYHYAPYEPSALKRLMGRYATREDQVDDWLRGQVFVDLYSVVRHALRAGVENYSIKKLEPLYGFVRQTTLEQANPALARLQVHLELADRDAITAEERAVVEGYNADDCASTHALRDWLEACRDNLVSSGTTVPRPQPPVQPEPDEARNVKQQQINALIVQLTQDVPDEVEERTAEQQARWILAHLLGWHQREDKATWWEYFRLEALTADELVDERAALSRLTFMETVARSKTGIPTDRYTFEPQDTDLRGDEELRMIGGERLGTSVGVCTESRTIDIKKTKATADIHPEAVFAHTQFNSKEQAEALWRLGQYVVEHGIEGVGDYRAARALLLNEPPPLGGELIRQPDESSLQAARRVAGVLGSGVFPIQGPPGTGKSYTGARMICQLVATGKRVGITANSHKVIRNLIDKVLDAADEMGVNLCCVQKPKEMEPDQERLLFAKDNKGVFEALANKRCQVAGATHFLWSRVDAHNCLDVLVVDEAAQMSLANVVAVAQSAKTLILLGDPQQLDQPTQGTHPDGTGVSSLEHVLKGEHTLAPDRGLFLDTTWRLHPAICAFNSELFYDGKLTAQEGCGHHLIRSNGPVSGSGLCYIPVSHQGNRSSSVEEAETVAELVRDILAADTCWIDGDGVEHRLTMDDIVIITPYNAQVFEIQQRLPYARVGTVDKFQGQEAPIAIYSLATSSLTEAPHGMEFLYSANRFNVAISRAKCLAILIASADIFEAECKTPRQMQLVNAFCRYLECADPA